MAGKASGVVMVSLGGNDYKLKYNYAAIDAIESHFDEQAGLALSQVDRRLKHFLFFLVAGLQEHHPEIDEKFIESLDPQPPIIPVSEKIAEALELSYRGPVKSPGKPEPEKAKTGKK